MSGSDYIFIANDLDLARGRHHGVFLQKDYEDQGRAEIIIAEWAELPVLNPGHAMQAEFFNGYNYLLDLKNRQDVTTKFDNLIVRLDNQEAQEQYRRKAETTLNLSRSDQPKDIAEFQWRVTTPVATLLLALMAVPLARSAPRESRMRNVLIAVGIYIGLFTMTSVVRTGIEQSRLPEFPGMWGAYIVQLILLVVLVSQPWMKRR
jgi:lipopolysaccharide export system permease protein